MTTLELSISTKVCTARTSRPLSFSPIDIFPAAVIGVGDRQQQGIAEYRHNVFESDAVLAQISRSLRVVPFEFVSGHPTGAFFVQSEIPSATAIRNVT